MRAMYIDAHCHLEKETYGDELEAVIERAGQAGLSHLIAVGASRVCAGAAEAQALAERYAHIYFTAGIHPHEAQHASAEEIAKIRGFLDHPKLVALGEIGLDFFYDNSPRDEQRSVFKELLAMSRDTNVPAMFHIRDAHPETLAIIDEVGLPERGAVVHCFTAGPAEAQEYLKRGVYLSIPGVVTFKKAEELRQAVAQIPLERMLIETDCPYLAPVPYRGQRNEPAYVVKTAEKIAEIRNLPLEEVARATSQNASAFYRLDGA
ncbi:MAG: TatD family hydrolase [Myxococcota bacterium]|nr:TatD family hydrolase [Myxococcota bacterium]